MFKVNRIDARFNGHTHYRYFASLIKPVSFKDQHTALIQFDAARFWCTEAWGTSAELDIQSIKLRRGIPGSVTEWCWRSDFTKNKFRIYLKDSAEATLFKLRWC